MPKIIPNIISAQLIGFLSCFLLWSCAGPTLVHQVKTTDQYLLREWTIPSRDLSAEGDRGAEFSDPAIFENNIIIGTRNFGVTSYYPDHQLIRWKLAIKNGVVSPIAVDKKVAYFQGGDGNFYAVDTEFGQVKWTYENKMEFASKPTLKEGRVLVHLADDSVLALDAVTGKWLWNAKRKGSSDNVVIRGLSQPVVDQGEVIVGSNDGSLLGLNFQDGYQKWEKRLGSGNKFNDVDATPVILEKNLYIAAYDGNFYALKRSKSGGGYQEVLYKFEAGGARSVLIENQRVYLPSSNGTVYCLELASGKKNWEFELDTGVPTQIASYHQELYFGSSDQYLYGIRKESGQPIARFNVGSGSGFQVNPTVLEKDFKFPTLVMLSMAGNLYGFRLLK